jgi:putative transposase
MKQRHSYTNLLYHLVFRTKYREHFIDTPQLDDALRGFIQKKAHDLDAYVEGYGSWNDHVHLLLRTRPTTALSSVYRQLKGFSSRAWHKQFPDLPFAWADGVWAVTVTPDDCDSLRAYIRRQRDRHDAKAEVEGWEPDDSRDFFGRV